MNPSIEDALDALRVFYLDGGELALLLDYDGTLTPIVARPELARLDPSVRRLLERLAGLPRVHLGVVSGRKLDELIELVDLPGICYAGAAGMELMLDDRRVVNPLGEQAAAVVAEMTAELADSIAQYPGAWIEDKRFACTVHYRQVAADQIESLRAEVEGLVCRLADGVRIVEGPMALELAPAFGWHKGDAVRTILGHLGASKAMVVYAGDGGNDTDAFDAVSSFAGLTIGVGPDAPAAARFRLPNPAALHDFLSRLASVL